MLTDTLTATEITASAIFHQYQLGGITTCPKTLHEAESLKVKSVTSQSWLKCPNDL